jgi:uncharacterized protein
MRVAVADLVKRPGASRSVVLDEAIGGLGVGGTTLTDAPVHLELRLERILEGLVVRGTVSATWEGECARCLRPLEGRLILGVDELFETDPVEGETYRLEHDTIDLEPLTRDAVGLELPIMPLCRADCAGICPECGADRNETACTCSSDRGDDRWAALDELLERSSEPMDNSPTDSD